MKTSKEGPTYILSESLKKSKQKEIILIFKIIIKFPEIKDELNLCIMYLGKLSWNNQFKTYANNKFRL